MVHNSFFSTRFEQRVHLILEQRQLRDAMRVLNDDDEEEHDDGSAGDTMLGVFRLRLNAAALALRDAGNDEHRIFEDLSQLVIRAGMETIGHLLEQAYDNAGLEKQNFRGAAAGGNDDDDDGGVMECGICFEEFVDGEQVSVMPCPCRGHRFHPDCITKWLGINITCPLCRHELPTPWCR